MREPKFQIANSRSFGLLVPHGVNIESGFADR